MRPYGYPGAPPAGYAQPPGVLGAPPGAVVVQSGNGPRLVTGGNAAPSGGYQWVNQGLTYPPSGYGGYGGYPAYTPQHSAVNGAVLTAAQQQAQFQAFQQQHGYGAAAAGETHAPATPRASVGAGARPPPVPLRSASGAFF